MSDNQFKNLTDISTILAAALLLQQKELSIIDIRTLPFVENDDTAQTILGRLQRNFDIEKYQRHQTQSHADWEDVIRLRTFPSGIS